MTPSTQACLLYRAAVLTEKSERLWINMRQLEKVLSIRSTEPSPELERRQQEIDLMWWEVRELVKEAGNVARYTA